VDIELACPWTNNVYVRVPFFPQISVAKLQLASENRYWETNELVTVPILNTAKDVIYTLTA
jgi:hypothetical protein